MVEGNFVDGDKPVVQAVIPWNDAVQGPYFVLDTGFTGDLFVTPEIADELGLEVSGVLDGKTPGGDIINMPTATAIAVMEGQKLFVTAVIAKGWPLLGISFLQKFNYQAVVNCRYTKVRLEVVHE
jgi:predicted aspartyl protease